MWTIKQLLTLTTYVTAGNPESSIHKTTCPEEQKAWAVTGLTVWEWLGCVPCDTFPFFIKRPNHHNHRWIFSYLALGHIVLHRLVTYNCDFIWDKLWNVFKLKCLWAFNFYMNTNKPLCEDLAVPPRRGTWPFQVWEEHRATGSNKLLSSFMCI